MGALANKKHQMAADVTNTNTFTTAYPTGQTQASLLNSTGGQLVFNQDKFPQAASGAGTVAFAFGASNITVTNNTGLTLTAGSEIRLSFGDTDRKGSYNVGIPASAPAVLTAATGTSSDTIADVGAAFSQATLNNNFKALADKVNALVANVSANQAAS
jgi:hypothetical protein